MPHIISRSSRLSATSRFVARLSRPSLRQVTALVLTVALLTPSVALARPLANATGASFHSQVAAPFGFAWTKLLGFFSGAQGRNQGRTKRLPLERPLPGLIPPGPPPTKAEHEAKVAKIETNTQGQVELEQGQRIMLTATPLDAEGNAVHGLVAEWESSDPQTVEVTRDGEATAKQPGVTHLTAVAGHRRLTVPVRVSPQSVPEVQPQSARRRSERNAADVRFVNARWSPESEPSLAGAALRAGGAKIMRAALVQTGGTGGPLPSGEVGSLYTPENSVGLPPGRTEPGAITPPTAFAGSETPLSANYTASVPLMSLPGRGLDLNLGLTYNSRLWHKSASGGTTYLTYDVDAGWPGPGFRFRFPQLERHAGSGGDTYTLTGPDGTRHQMVAAGANLYETTDGTFIRLTTGDTLGVNYPDGSRIRFGAANGARFYPARLRARNGNLLLINYVGGGGPRISSIQDTLGRYTRFHYDASGKLVAITAPGYAGGADQQVARFYYEDLTINPSFTVATRAPASARVLRFVYFPGTRSGYNFTYSTYGMAHRVRQKRSMTVDHMGLDRTGTVTFNGDGAADTIYNYPTGPSNLGEVPRYTRRTDEWAGRTTGMSGTGEAPYHTFAVDQAQGRSTITAPDGAISEAHTIVAPEQWNDGLVSEVTIKQGATVMAKTATVWEHDGGNRNHRPQKISATDEAGQTRSTAFGYTSFNNVSVTREYDFNGTTELRRTETTYETRAQYMDRRVLHLPTSVKVFAGGASAPISRVDLSYDTAGANLTARPDIIMHEETYNPASATYTSATDSRGNLTSVTRYADAAGGSGQSIDTMTYDIAGNVMTQTADCCQQKRYTYTKGFEYAYPTEEARGSAGQLQTSANYDFNTGLVRSGTDENNQTTVTHYYPDSLRFYRTDQPNGGYTEAQYGDGLYQNGAPNRMHSYVYTDTKMDATGRELSQDRYVDGRGATARNFDGNSTPGTTTTDVEYDVMGRAVHGSNPYYSAGVGSPINPDDLWTTVEYDALGRPRSERLPDGNEARAIYAGNVTTITDPAGKSRRQITDALGRLIRVDEPDASGNLGTVGAPTQSTTYSYNALDNLIKVIQGEQQRFFKYDGFGRLTHERHVEQAAPHSEADPQTGNNNWSRRTIYNTDDLVTDAYDARGVHAHIEYDGLNRIKETTYSDGTPKVTYKYDQERADYYNDGKMTEVMTAAVGSTPQTVQEYDYDLMGRVANHRQRIDATTYTMSYGYNDQGQMTRLTYPSGRVVSHGYDDAARLTSVTDGTRTYASGMTYKAHGALESETWGNGATHTRDYNTNVQLSQIKLANGATEVQRYDYHFGQINMSTGVVDATKNTGQIGRIDSFVGGSKQFDQRFSYDSLGRLDLAAEHQGSNGALGWRTDYEYDRWGNRYQPQQGSQTNLYYIPVERTDISTATNRFTTQVGYDNAGNITADQKFRALSYWYDANNRLIKTVRDEVRSETTSVYDGNGRRVQTMIDGEWHHFVYDVSGQVIAEYGPEGWLRDRIYRNGQMLATDEAVGPCRKTIEQFVQGFYWGAFGRQPTQAEQDGWAASLRTAQGQGQAQLLAEAQRLGRTLFGSAEYTARNRTNLEYVHDLYWAWLQRAPEENGLVDWLDVVQTQGRTAALEGFATGTEFIDLAARLCVGAPTRRAQWLLSDHLGSVRVVLNEAGQVVGRHEYLPFGDEYSRPAQGGQAAGPQTQQGQAVGATSTGLHSWYETIRPRFAGLEKDAATGLEHTEWRKYDGWAGRCTTPDPYSGSLDITDPQTFNRYVYANNDPVNNIDPSGLFFGRLFRALIGAIVGFFTGGPVGAVIGGALGFISNPGTGQGGGMTNRDDKISSDDTPDCDNPFMTCKEIGETIRDLTKTVRRRRVELDPRTSDYPGHAQVWAKQKSELNKCIQKFKGRCKDDDMPPGIPLSEAEREAREPAPRTQSGGDAIRRGILVPIGIGAIACIIFPGACGILAPRPAPAPVPAPR